MFSDGPENQSRTAKNSATRRGDCARVAYYAGKSVCCATALEPSLHATTQARACFDHFGPGADTLEIGILVFRNSSVWLGFRDSWVLKVSAGDSRVWGFLGFVLDFMDSWLWVLGFLDFGLRDSWV